MTAIAERPAFFEQILLFSRRLQTAGIYVNPANLITLCECLQQIELGDRTAFYAAGRASLISSRAQVPVFDQVFAEFWLQQQNEVTAPQLQQTNLGKDTERDETETEEEKTTGPAQLSYSPDDILIQQDFAEMPEKETAQTRKLIAELLAIVANCKGRRRKPGHKGNALHLRKMLRHQAVYGKDSIKLEYRQPRLKKNRLFVLCDVSGSMAAYSRFLIQFMFALRRQVSKLEIGVFSTHTTLITDKLNKQSVAASLREVAREVPDWDGGTNLGQSFQELHDHLSLQPHNKNTILIVLSDGWDRGDPDKLRDAIAAVSRQVRTLLWLNPLLSRDGYRPLCQGMQITLPYIDYFLPAHNLQSLRQMLRQLRELWH
ncbi:MAG: vWA domain-containing protein [Gammaproteobacteria bacterium]